MAAHPGLEFFSSVVSAFQLEHESLQRLLLSPGLLKISVLHIVAVVLTAQIERTRLFEACKVQTKEKLNSGLTIGL